jgi:hypothetical protein
MRPSDNGHRHATVRDFRDLDIMLKLEAEAGEEGWVEVELLAAAMGFEEEGLGAPARRLAWMRRYGMVEYDRERRLYRLTEGGERVTQAKLRAGQSRAIEAVPDEAMVEVMSSVLTRYRHGEPMLAHLLRREFQYGTAPR